MKPNRIIGILIILASVSAGSVVAQISAPATPVSFNNSLSANLHTVTTPSVDVAAMLAEDEIEEAEGLPFRFGAPFDVDYSIENSGRWEELSDGGHVWRLKISSPGAFSINLLYSRYHLPPGATLHLYNEDRSMTIGAFTERNNKDHGEFATAPVKGDVTIVEYYEPAEVRGRGELAINRIVHAYKDIFSFFAKDADGFGSSGWCNNNVNCPEGEPWQDDKRGVAMILTSGGSRICSGSLVNNVRQDETPYFLTANHCLGSESTWIIMFNYESPTCADIDGPTNMTISGTTLRASYSTSDFGLVQLSATPPESYAPYYNGWSNINTAASSAVGIHHPSGDIKKISFDYDPLTSTNYLQSSGTTHWRVGQWEDGTTEPGSSGSPLFDPTHRIVGQLHGGYASCESLTPDWYGKFSLSWTGGGSSSNRLRDWLDPDNTGAMVLDGYDPYAGVNITHTPLSDTKDTLNAYEVSAFITSNTTLVPDSLLLYYDAGSGWVLDTLTPGGAAEEYTGYITAQSPGTDISYYLFALDANGKADTTDTYGFRVIDYALTVTPEVDSRNAPAYDTAWFSLTVTNTGVLADEYSLSFSGNNWTTGLWDETGTSPISTTGQLAADESFALTVSVEVPYSAFGDYDSVQVVATSIGDGVLSAEARLKTYSDGTTGSFPWSDSFPEDTLFSIRWVYNSGAEVSFEALNPPSPPYALNLNGEYDTLLTQPIDLTGQDGAVLSYYFERGGAGNPPAVGDDLWIDYRNSSDVWTNLVTHLGGGSAMTEFELSFAAIPSDALHNGFQLRLHSAGDCSTCDDWYVDNIRLDFAAAIVAAPSQITVSLAQGDSTTRDLVIDNSGQGSLDYSLVVQLALKDAALFTGLIDAGRVEPAQRVHQIDENYLLQAKGVEDGNMGLPVLYDAGGPDLFGHYWIDSDEPGGPVFAWEEVSATGTDVLGGLNDDNYVGPLDLGFDFPFYGNLYSYIYIGSNGMIGFSPTDMNARIETPLPNASTPNNIIALLWDDLNPDDGDNPGAHVYMDTTGGRCVIQFVDYPEYNAATGDVVNAEVILEADGSIKLQYLTIAPGFDVLSCAVGIENSDGTDGLEVVYQAGYLHDNLAVQIVNPYQWLTVDRTSGMLPPGDADTILCNFVTEGLDTGLYQASIVINSNDPDPLDNPLTIPVELTVTGSGGPDWICGDIDNDGEGPNIGDLIYLVDYMFNDGPAPTEMDAANVDGVNGIDIGDLVYLVDYMFNQGPPPSCP